MAAGSTYTPIATTTLGSAAASYTFSSIPSTYTDLVLIANISSSSASAGVNGSIRLNGDTGSNYSETALEGDGSTASSFRNSSQTSIPYMMVYGTDPGTQILHFQNYSNSTTYKTVLARENFASGYLRAVVGLWRSTSAINSIELIAGSVNFASGSTFTLYGITAA